MKPKILFCGTPQFAIPSLEALVNDPEIEIVGVFTQPDRPSGRGQKLNPSSVKEYALARGLRVETPENINAPETMEVLKGLGAEACVVVAYGQILKQAFLDLYPQKCVNLHGSLLPRWRGAAPIQRSLMAGDARTGVCLQVVVRKLDAGPLIGERALDLAPEMDAVELHNKLSHLGADLFRVEFKDFLRGVVSPAEQDVSKVTHAAKIDKLESRMDWSKDAGALHNLVRGLAMGPQAWTDIRGHCKIHRTLVTGDRGEPGEIVSVTKTSFSVACGSGGALEILEIQPESKKKMSAEEFLKGHALKKGERFA